MGRALVKARGGRPCERNCTSANLLVWWEPPPEEGAKGEEVRRGQAQAVQEGSKGQLQGRATPEQVAEAVLRYRLPEQKGERERDAREGEVTPQR